uniref:Transmembrane protein 194 n=1 Tax=Kalanchoe fedtschenkoi TaxID=63787 RepID=A0A7N0TXY2_KALFE
MELRCSLVSHLLAFSFIYLFVLSLCHHYTAHTSSNGISLANPVIEVAPSPIAGQSTAAASKDAFSCQRVRVSGISRLQLGSYANSFTVTLVPSAVIPDRLRTNVQVCFHRNASRGLCQCHEYDWKNIRKGLWTSSMSPYEERYVDVKFIGGVPGSVTVTVKEDPQQWRLVFLALGFFMLLLAPVMSNWVLFYYSSSMVIGVMLVIIFLLFQGMKFLPTCRKSVFYLFIYGSSLIGAGSFLLHHYSMMINSIFVNFGLNDEILNPVTIFTLVLIVIAGAGLGFWIVRRFIISADGHVDVGIAQFVKWAMRILGSTSIPLSSDDTPLGFGALVSCWTISIVLHYVKWISERRDENHRWGGFWPWRNQQSVTSHHGAEFLSRKSKRLGNKGTQWTRTQSPPNFNGSPVQGLVSPSAAKFTRSDIRDHYSTFHNTPNRRRFSRREWEEFTEESTKQAMSELASTPEFTEWIIENANRIKLQSDDSSYESEAGSSGEDCCGQWQQN